MFLTNDEDFNNKKVLGELKGAEIEIYIKKSENVLKWLKVCLKTKMKKLFF